MREMINNFNKMLENPAAWAKINSKGDLFDIRLKYNPYDKIETVPLYRLHTK